MTTSLRTALLASMLCATVAAAQQPMLHHHETMHRTQPGEAAMSAAPTEPGQSAFAAIGEIVSLLEADTATNWSKVDIDALRQHLVDMDNVTLRAQVTTEALPGSVRFTVTGSPEVAASIKRMVMAHAMTMSGADGWTMSAEDRGDGAVLTVLPSRVDDTVKIKALGFFGVMTRGMHHQQHHVMLAKGLTPHQQNE